VTGRDIRLKGHDRGVTRGTPGSRFTDCQYAICILLNINFYVTSLGSRHYHLRLVSTRRDDHYRKRYECNAGPNPKVRQWRRPRKSHDSDLLLVRNHNCKGQNTGGASAVTKELVGEVEELVVK